MPRLSDSQRQVILEEVGRIQFARKKLPDFTKINPNEHIPAPPTLDDKGLRQLALLQGVVIEKHFASHRRILGPLVVRVKKWWNRAVSRVVLSVVGRQLEFNQEMWHLAMTVRMQDERIKRLEAMLEKQGLKT